VPVTTPNRLYPYPIGGDSVDVAGDIQDLAVALDQDVDAIADLLAATRTTVLRGSWTNLGYANGWGDNPSAYVPLQYVVINSICYLRGNGYGRAAQMNLGMTVLPVGVRPLYNTNFAIIGGRGLLCNLNINTGGVITPQNVTGANSDNMAEFIPLGSISFPVF
jgi:hypothetical protein